MGFRFPCRQRQTSRPGYVPRRRQNTKRTGGRTARALRATGSATLSPIRSTISSLRGASRAAGTTLPARTAHRVTSSSTTSPSVGASFCRVLVIGGFLGIACVILASRLFWVQVIRHTELSSRAIEQHEARVIDPGLRGDILDRGGRVLRHTLSDHSLIARPARVRHPARSARQLAAIIDRDAGEIEALLRRREPVVEIHAHLESDLARAIIGLKLRGIEVEEPGRRIALVRGGDLLGDLNRAGEAVEGIERSMNAYLAAEDGWHMRYRDASGGDIQAPPDRLPCKPPRHGDSVVLTIDSRLQWMVEEILEKAVAKHQAISGSAVLVDVWTGEILALASAGGEIEPGRRVRRLRPVEGLCEPGSTFKITVFAAALDLGILTDDSLYFAEQGSLDFGGFVIRDVKEMGWLCAADVIAQSSNICTAKIGEEVGARDLYAYCRSLGFGQKTMVRLPGEQGGILRPVSRWSGRSAATVAIGQEISVTPLQLAMAYAAVANGGELLKPRLVREVRRPDGSVRLRQGPEVIRRAMRPETAATLRGYLWRAVEHGTGGRAIPGNMPVAGKTGTAQKARADGKGYAKGCYVASFAGFFPADRPEIVAVVVIDEPRGAYYGGEVAAPIFADIVRCTTSIAATATDHRRPQETAFGAGERIAGHAARSFAPPGAATPVARLAGGRGMQPTGVGSGARHAIVQQPPATDSVPDLRGLTLRAAMRQLRASGLGVKARGRGLVIEQVPPAGAPLPAEGHCRLLLASHEEREERGHGDR